MQPNANQMVGTSAHARRFAGVLSGSTWTRRQFAKLAVAALACGSVLGTTGAFGSTSVAVAATSEADDANAQVDALIHEILLDAVQADAFNTNQMLVDPQTYGIDPSEVGADWATCGPEYAAAQVADAQELLAALDAIDYEALDRRHRDVYDTLWRQADLDARIHAPRFAYHDQHFTGMNAMQSSIPVAFDSFEVRTEEDVYVLEALLTSTLAEFQELCAYAREQAARGTLVADAEDVLDDCAQIIGEPMLGSFKQGLYNKIDALGLDAQTTQAHHERIDAAIEEFYVPGYRLVIDTFTEFVDSGVPMLRGICQLPDGQEYYELQWRLSTGLDTDVEEGKSRLTEALFGALFEYVGSRLRMIGQQEPVLPFESYRDALEYLIKATADDFPAIDDVEYQVVDGDPLLMEDAAGYYVLPPVDQPAVQQIRVNPQGPSIQHLESFMTIAHEGVPGHMYMVALHSQLFGAESTLVLQNLAYLEGYASYVESLSPSYLDEELVSAWGAYSSAVLQIDRYISALLDIAVNYDDFSLQEAFGSIADVVDAAFDSLNPNGANQDLVSTREILGEADRGLKAFFAPMAGAILPYALGLLEFKRLRSKAEDALGERFDARGFHEAILGSGAVCFTSVERNVEDYIARVLG